jgi:hypothetical protein
MEFGRAVKGKVAARVKGSDEFRPSDESEATRLQSLLQLDLQPSEPLARPQVESVVRRDALLLDGHADKVILPDINGRELGGGDDFGGCSNSGRPSRGGEATQQLLQPAQELRKQGGWLRGFPPAPDRSLNGIALRLSALVLSQAL